MVHVSKHGTKSKRKVGSCHGFSRNTDLHGWRRVIRKLRERSVHKICGVIACTILRNDCMYTIRGMIINHFCGISRTTLGNRCHLVLSHHLTLSYPPTLLDDNSALQPLSEQQQNGRGREQPTTNHWMPPLLHCPSTPPGDKMLLLFSIPMSLLSSPCCALSVVLA